MGLLNGKKIYIEQLATLLMYACRRHLICLRRKEEKNQPKILSSSAAEVFTIFLLNIFEISSTHCDSHR